ncbi:MAG: hypothetical protein ACRC62_20010, partial [Microcoleus sp.]
MKFLSDAIDGDSDLFFDTEVGTGINLLEDGDSLRNSFAARALIMGFEIVQNSLSSFGTTPDFLTKMQVAFGKSFDVERAIELASAWVRGDFSGFPEIEIRSEAEINGALGAFSAATGKIYLSQEFLVKNAANVTAVAGVLLEEFGHFVDAQINKIDAIGDEGEIFSDLVQGRALSQEELAHLKGEDDSVLVFLDGELRAIEQKSQSDNLNFFAGQIKDWTDNPGKEYKISLFDANIPRQPIQQNFDNGFLKYEFGLNANIKSELFATPGNFGEAKFNYPVNINVDLPNDLSSNKTAFFRFGGSQVNGGLFSNIGQGSTGFEIPNAGLKFELNVDQAKFKNIEIKRPFLDPLIIPGIDAGIGKSEINLDLASFLAGKVNFDLLGGTVSANSPKITSLSPGNPPPANG